LTSKKRYDDFPSFLNLLFITRETTGKIRVELKYLFRSSGMIRQFSSVVFLKVETKMRGCNKRKHLRGIYIPPGLR
jgi:hypothetical protein